MTRKELENFIELFDLHSNKLLGALETYKDNSSSDEELIHFDEDDAEIFDNFQFIYNLIYVFHENSGYPLKFLKE